MISMNQIYKKSGSTLPFKDWLNEVKLGYFKAAVDKPLENWVTENYMSWDGEGDVQEEIVKQVTPVKPKFQVKPIHIVLGVAALVAGYYVYKNYFKGK
jgi:hypothetical protein